MRSLRLYLTGGATAVLEGWREMTIDIDIRLEPETDDVLRTPPRLGELYDAIEPELHRYPAIDPPTVRREVIEFTG